MSALNLINGLQLSKNCQMRTVVIQRVSGTTGLLEPAHKSWPHPSPRATPLKSELSHPLQPHLLAQALHTHPELFPYTLPIPKDLATSTP